MVVESGTPFRSRAFQLMWQTMINAFTYRDNFLRNRRAGSPARAGDGKDRFLYGLDWVVSVLVAIPTAMAALPLELLATAFARGGILTVVAEPLSDPGAEPG